MNLGKLPEHPRETIAPESKNKRLLSASTKKGKKKKGGTRTSVGRMTRRICSIEFRSGLSPPCMVKIFSSMMAAMGRQLKQSVNVFHSLML